MCLHSYPKTAKLYFNFRFTFGINKIEPARNDYTLFNNNRTKTSGICSKIIKKTCLMMIRVEGADELPLVLGVAGIVVEELTFGRRQKKTNCPNVDDQPLHGAVGCFKAKKVTNFVYKIISNKSNKYISDTCN